MDYFSSKKKSQLRKKCWKLLSNVFTHFYSIRFPYHVIPSMDLLFSSLSRVCLPMNSLCRCGKLISSQVLLKICWSWHIALCMVRELEQLANLFAVQATRTLPHLASAVPDLKNGRGMETVTLHAVWFALLTQVCLSVS